MKINQSTPLKGRTPMVITDLLACVLIVTLMLTGTGRALASDARAGPPGPPSALLPALVDTGAHDATLSVLTLTGDESPISLSPEFNPETTLYTARAEADLGEKDAPACLLKR